VKANITNTVRNTNTIYKLFSGKFYLLFLILLLPVLLISCSRYSTTLHNREISVEISISHNFPASVLDDFHSKELVELDSVSREAGFFQISRKAESLRDIQSPEEIIVGFSEKMDLSAVLNDLRSEGFQVMEIDREGNFALLRPDLESEDGDKGLLQQVEKLQARESISYIEPNYYYHTLEVTHPDDTYYSYQWNYSQIRLPQAWSDSTGSANVRIAVLDTGVSSQHPDLVEQVDEIDGYNIIADNNDFDDLDGHGTHVAGIVAAATNNNRGVAGVMWKSSIIPVKVLENNTGSWFDIARGIRYAAGLTEDPEISQPVDIINLSLGGANKSETVKAAVEEAREEGIIIVAAAGNFGEEGLLYPAAFSDVISVGAVDFNYPEEPGLAWYSNYSSELDILAPGGDLKVDSSNRGWKDGILSTHAGSGSSFSGSADYKFKEGTSMAAPHVSGVIGLMLANGMSRNQNKVRDILQNTSMKLADISQDIGKAGLLNAYWALHNPEKITLNLLRQQSGELQAWEKKELRLSGGDVNFSNLPPGEYLLQAHLDVQGNGRRDPGDYYGEIAVDLSGEDIIRRVELDMREVE